MESTWRHLCSSQYATTFSEILSARWLCHRYVKLWFLIREVKKALELQAVAGLFPSPWRASSSRGRQPQQRAAHLTPLHKLNHPCLGSIHPGYVHFLNQYCQFLYFLHHSSRALMRERERGIVGRQCCGFGSRIRDQVPFWPLDLGSGIRKRFLSDPGFQTHIFESRCWIRDPGQIKIRFRDKHPGSATPEVSSGK